MRLTTFTQKLFAIYGIISFCISMHIRAAVPETNSKIFTLTNGLQHSDIPFRLVNDLIVVPVVVEGKQQLNFLVDTGTSTPIILNKRYVKKLDLAYGRSVHFQGAGGDDPVQGTVIPAMSLQMGDAFAKQIGVVVLDNNPLAHLKVGGITIHGIIGASLFYSFAVEIDYLSQTIRLHDGQEFLQAYSYTALPMQVDMNRPILRIPVKWQDEIHTLNLMIDTGFDRHLLIYDHSSIHFRALDQERIGIGYSGGIMGNTANIELMQLGERKFFNVHTYFPLYSDYKAKGTGDGIIGNALLKHFCVILDYANNVFYIQEHLLWTPSLVQEKVPRERLN